MYDGWQSPRTATAATTRRFRYKPHCDRRRREQRDGPKLSECPESPRGTTERRDVGCGDGPDSGPKENGSCGTPLSVQDDEENEREDAKCKGPLFVRNMLEKLKTVMAPDGLDDETTKMVQMLVILRLNKTHQSLGQPAGNEENGDHRAGWIDES